jgi:hypothetical protein
MNEICHFFYITLIIKYIIQAMKDSNKFNRKDLIITVFIVLITVYLISKYVFGNWDYIKHFISNLF